MSVYNTSVLTAGGSETRHWLLSARRGNLDHLISLQTKDEIGELAENFNHMSAEIQKAVDALKKAAQENHLLFVNSVRMLAAAIDAKDYRSAATARRLERELLEEARNRLVIDLDRTRELAERVVATARESFAPEPVTPVARKRRRRP